MDCSLVKRQARELMQSRKKPIFLSAFLYLLLVVLFSYLSFRLIMPGREQLAQISERAMQLIALGDADGLSRLTASIEPRLGESLVSDLLSYLQAIVSFGFLLLCFRAVRGEELSPAMLLDGFGSWARVLLLEVLTRLIVTLGYWLLIIPGIIFSYNYRMAPYLLIRHPEYGVLDCMRESRLLMRGHRLALFRLDLSFLGWALLSCIPLLGIAAAVWALPYWNISCVLSFDSFSAFREDSPPPPEEDRFF